MDKRLLLACFALSIAGLSFPTTGRAQNDAADRTAIETTVGYYFTGADTKDVETMKKAFHPDAKMQFIRDGKLQVVTMPEWFERIASNPNPPTKPSSRKIVSIQLAGDAALATCDSDFATFRFVDYLSLLKIDGRWWIVGKTFHRYDK